jgi:gamma-glutamyl-gamma-aminobutyrate hydrolase PuuD
MSKEIKLRKGEDPKCAEIIEFCRAGDIHKVHSLYQKGLYPKDAILIGMPLEISPNGSIGQGAKHYLKNLTTTFASQKHDKIILPIPLDSFYLNRISNFTDENQKRRKLKNLVRNDIKALDGIVFPGDNFNFPPILANKGPYEAIMEYNGEKILHNEETIYSFNGKSLTGKEFYELYPQHKINPNAQSLHYEAELIRQLENTNKPVMCSCHGVQVYSVMKGAHMLAGITGHNYKKPMKTEIAPDAVAHSYLGDVDNTALHIHKLALDPRVPEGLKVVGKAGNVVEVLEETSPIKAPSYLFQIHPEFVKNHPALESFVSSVIQHHYKKQIENKLSNSSRPLTQMTRTQQ